LRARAIEQKGIAPTYDLDGMGGISQFDCENETEHGLHRKYTKWRNADRR